MSARSTSRIWCRQAKPGTLLKSSVNPEKRVGRIAVCQRQLLTAQIGLDVLRQSDPQVVFFDPLSFRPRQIGKLVERHQRRDEVVSPMQECSPFGQLVDFGSGK